MIILLFGPLTTVNTFNRLDAAISLKKVLKKVACHSQYLWFQKYEEFVVCLFQEFTLNH